jgi:hypothetical protein
MLAAGTDTVHGDHGLPHGFGGADATIMMPLQCSIRWDGLGHIFDHGVAWNGRSAADVVASEGDDVTGIERIADVVAGRGVLLDVVRVVGADGELLDRFAITVEHPEDTIAVQEASSQGVSRQVCKPRVDQDRPL